MKKTTNGFTIVELLIVIVVIAILAAISVVAYYGIQQRGRDAQRAQDVKTIAKAIEAFYIDNGKFPESACGSNCPSPKKINNSWLTTSDGSWSLLEAQLVPKYISSLPKDPQASASTQPAISGGLNYDYVVLQSDVGTKWCDNSPARPFYLLAVRYETRTTQTDEIIGNCTGDQPSPYGASSDYRVIKN